MSLFSRSYLDNVSVPSTLLFFPFTCNPNRGNPFENMMLACRRVFVGHSALIELSMIVSLTVMKVIYDREKLKEAAQRQLSNSWQSACRLSQASRNLILDVSKGSVDLLNLSRHRHSAADAGNNDSGGGFSYFGRSRGSHGKGTTDRSSNELHALHVAVENA